MLIHHDPDEWKPVSSQHTCEFHKLHPGKSYAGCTCSGSYGVVRRTPEEVREIKDHKRKEREDAILAEAEIIRARRRS